MEGIVEFAKRVSRKFSETTQRISKCQLDTLSCFMRVDLASKFNATIGTRE